MIRSPRRDGEAEADRSIVEVLEAAQATLADHGEDLGDIELSKIAAFARAWSAWPRRSRAGRRAEHDLFARSSRRGRRFHRRSSDSA